MPHAVRGKPGAKQQTSPESACWQYDAAQSVAALQSQEWLLTNGLGGYAMGSASGVPTRRYHALLIAATRPPVGRIAALNAMVERVQIGGRVIECSSFEFTSDQQQGGRGALLHPAGARHLTRFEHDEAARWTYAADGLELTRELVLFSGKNAAGLRYTLRRDSAAAHAEASFTIRPLASLRDVHNLIRQGWARDPAIELQQQGVVLRREGLALHIQPRGQKHARFVRDEQWWNNFFYREDADRGQDCVEDLFSPGYFECTLKPGEASVVVEFAAWVGNDAPAHDVQTEILSRRDRFARLAAATMPAHAGSRERDALAILARAADAFIVASRGPDDATNGVSTIAGYPWFSDWGRDTFIALPGLLLATGRHDEARRELERFARSRRGGIIPNVFSDQTGEPEYNTVDASLWFIHAACSWLAATGDHAGFGAVLRDACLDVVDCYRRGTDFNIAMDPADKLITAGTNVTQLTWMDARRDGVTFTPRHGKAVEINALWYNALRSLAVALSPAKGTLVADLNDLAAAVGRSLASKFWDERQHCLFDCLTPGDGIRWEPDASLRPNQILAVSLPHSALSAVQQQAVVHCVRTRLVTPMGVRTLDPADPRYRGRYRGTLFERDGAYHQGTACPWLLGPVAEADRRAGAFTAAAKSEAISILQPMLSSIAAGKSEARPGTCAGQIAEVFDGDHTELEPQRAGGCPAQAWSIAETLRVLKLIVG
jgi:predicted glycogen debranching enzyme